MQGIEIKAPDLQTVRELYDRGLYVQAYRQAGPAARSSAGAGPPPG